MPPSLMSCPAEILSSAMSRWVVSYIAFRLLTSTSGLSSPSWLYTCTAQFTCIYSLLYELCNSIRCACMHTGSADSCASRGGKQASKHMHSSATVMSTSAMHTRTWSVIGGWAPPSSVSALHCTSVNRLNKVAGTAVTQDELVPTRLHLIYGHPSTPTYRM